MTPTTTALLFSIGASGWVFAKLSRRSGDGNLTPAIVATVVTFTGLFIMSLLLFKAIL
ncbi:MAG TPA: hypothetical protein VJC09_02865 [Candidatus Saccharimonadales bacterium]|nr:hypothetical protein [Candidatus Saccharimonadales bacterium]